MNKLVLTGLLAAGTMTHLQGAQPAGQRPNILFILSDDHTSQAWGIYGGVLAEYAHNANIRRLAKEGVVLDNCFCTNSISAPSRASILTCSLSWTKAALASWSWLHTIAVTPRSKSRGRCFWIHSEM